MFRLKKASFLQEYQKIVTRNNVFVANQSKSLTIKDIPHPRSFPLIGTKFNFLATGSGTRLHEYVDLRHRELGPIFRESLGGGSDLIFISDPVLIQSLFLNLDGKHPAHILPEPWILYEKLYGSKRGLFFMNGEEWLSNRRIMNKHLLRDDADKWLERPIHETVTSFVEKWKTEAGRRSFIPNLESDFYRLSLDVIIKVLIGTDSSFVLSKQYDELLKIFSETVKKIFQTTTKLYSLPLYWCERFNLKVWTEFKESVDLSLLLAQKIVSEMLNQKKKNNGLIMKLCDEKLSNEIITRIIADFIIAAGDTTAFTSLWILLLLSKNNVLKEELRAGDDSYVKCVVKESMRLYPVAPFLTRILPRDNNLGNYKINKGTPIIASIYTSGRDEQNFSKADKFLPYRWSRNDPRRHDLVNHVPSASLPFALGARSCIGKKIAMAQLTEVIKQIVANFDFSCINSAEIKAITSQVLVPNQPLDILLSLRDKEGK